MPSINLGSHSLRTELQIESLASKIAIPAGIGSIKEIFVPDQGPAASSSVIIHIEEAHGQTEGQENIEKILNHLKSQYDLRTVFLEGAWNKLDPEEIRFFEDEKTNREVLNDLNEKGLIGGAELFLSSDRTGPRAFGVEDIALYRKNLEQFRDVYSAKPQTDTFLKKERSKIIDESSKAFNPELKKFFKDWAFRTEIAEQPFAGLNRLGQAAEKYLSLDLTDAYEQYDWPQLVRFFKLRELEKKASDSSKATKQEERAFADWLELNKISKEYSGIFNASSTGDLRGRLEKFYTVAAPKGFRFEDYPQLTRRIGTAILASELQAPDLFGEVEKLNDLILSELAETEAEQGLIERYKKYILLKKLFNLELTAADHKKIAGHKMLPPDVPLHKVAEQAVQFYTTAKEREQAIFENMLSRMKEIGEPNAVLVTGGFHSEGLSKLFKTDRISYVRIGPRITKPQTSSSYLSLMTLGDSKTARDSTVRQASLIQGIPVLRQELGDPTADLYLDKLQASLEKVGIRSQVPFGELIASLRSPDQVPPSLAPNFAARRNSGPNAVRSAPATPNLTSTFSARRKLDPQTARSAPVFNKPARLRHERDARVRSEMRGEAERIGSILRERLAKKIADAFSPSGLKTLIKLYQTHASHLGFRHLLIEDVRMEVTRNSLTLGLLEHLLSINGFPVEHFQEDGLLDIVPIGGVKTLTLALEHAEAKLIEPTRSEIRFDSPDTVEMDRVHAVIVAGGQGTRLWPYSTAEKPKALCSFSRDGKSLVRKNIEMLDGLIPRERIFISIPADLADAFRKELPEIAKSNFIIEPVAKGVDNAFAFATTVISKKNEDATVVALLADTEVDDNEKYRADLVRIIGQAQSGANWAFVGVKPTGPHTGYGYLECEKDPDAINGALTLKRFAEKPDQEAAREYMAQDNYYWNPSIYAWDVGTMFATLKNEYPSDYYRFRQIKEAMDIESEQGFVKSVFEELSDDMFLMDRALHIDEMKVTVVPGEFQWNDAGDWDSVATFAEKDSEGNSKLGKGEVSLRESSDSVVFAVEGQSVEVEGLTGYVTAVTNSVVLVLPRKSAQGLKELVNEISQDDALKQYLLSDAAQPVVPTDELTTLEDNHGNVFVGNVKAKNSKNSFARTDTGLVAVMDTENISITRTGSTVFVKRLEPLDRTEQLIEIRNKDGIHFRPGAVIAKLCGMIREKLKVRLWFQPLESEERFNTGSFFSMALDLKAKDKDVIQVIAEGGRSEQLRDEVLDLVAELLGDRDALVGLNFKKYIERIDALREMSADEFDPARSEMRFGIPAEAVVAEHSDFGQVIDIEKCFLTWSDQNVLAQHIAALEQLAFGGHPSFSREKTTWSDLMRWNQILLLLDHQKRLMGVVRAITPYGDKSSKMQRIMTHPGGPRGQGRFLMDAYLSTVYRLGFRDVFWSSFGEQSDEFYEKYIESRESDGVLEELPLLGNDFSVLLQNDPLDQGPFAARSETRHSENMVKRALEESWWVFPVGAVILLGTLVALFLGIRLVFGWIKEAAQKNETPRSEETEQVVPAPETIAPKARSEMRGGLDLGKVNKIWASRFSSLRTRMRLFKLLIAADLFRKAESQSNDPAREIALKRQAIRFLTKRGNWHLNSSDQETFYLIRERKQGYEDFASYATRERLLDILDRAISEQARNKSRYRSYKKLIRKITFPSSRSEARDLNAETQEIDLSEPRPRTILKEPKIYHEQGSRDAQEDRYIQQRIELDKVPHGRGWLLAVMDGHSGARTADILSGNLVRVFQDAILLADGDLRRALKMLHSRLFEMTKNEDAGSTMALVYMPDDDPAAHILCHGDSFAFLKGGNVHYKTPSHAIYSSEERALFKKILQQKGLDPDKIIVSDPESENLRVKVQIPDGKETDVFWINLTRAYGDKYFQDTFIPTAFIKRVDLSDATDVVDIVVASDGLMVPAPFQISEEKRMEQIAGVLSSAHSGGTSAVQNLGQNVGGKNAPDNTTILHWTFSPARSEARSLSNLMSSIYSDPDAMAKARSLTRFSPSEDIRLTPDTRPVIDLLKVKEEEIHRILTQQMGVPEDQVLTLREISPQSSTIKKVYECAVAGSDGQRLSFGIRFYTEKIEKARGEAERMNSLAELSPEVIKIWHLWEMPTDRWGAYSAVSIGEYRDGALVSNRFNMGPLKEKAGISVLFGRAVARLWATDLKQVKGGALTGYFDTDDTRWVSNFGLDNEKNFYFFDGGYLHRVSVNFILTAASKLGFSDEFMEGFWSQLRTIIRNKNLDEHERSIRERLAANHLLQLLEELLIEHGQNIEDPNRSEMREEVIQGLVQKMRLKDGLHPTIDLLGHGERVRGLSLAIADEMRLRLSNHFRDMLATSALLHDIGKLQIPDFILEKPSDLTEEERVMINLHPLLGTYVLRSFSGFENEQDIIVSHHERFDGKGYPNGLRGEKIPFFSRIISVADVYDALVSPRVYHTAMSGQEAAEEVSRNAGTQFDPVVVSAFEQAFENKNRSELRDGEAEEDLEARLRHVFDRDFLKEHAESIRVLEEAIGLDLRSYSRDDRDTTIEEVGRDIVDALVYLSELAHVTIEGHPALADLPQEQKRYATFVARLGERGVEWIMAARYNAEGKEYNHYVLSNAFNVPEIDFGLIYGLIEEHQPRDPEGKISILFFDKEYPEKKTQLLAKLFIAGGIPHTKRVKVILDSGEVHAVQRLSDMLKSRSEIFEQTASERPTSRKASGFQYRQSVDDVLAFLSQIKNHNEGEPDTGLTALVEWQKRIERDRIDRHGAQKRFEKTAKRIHAPLQIILGHLKRNNFYPVYEKEIIDFLFEVEQFDKDLFKWAIRILIEDAAFQQADKNIERKRQGEACVALLSELLYRSARKSKRLHREMIEQLRETARGRTKVGRLAGKLIKNLEAQSLSGLRDALDRSDIDKYLRSENRLDLPEEQRIRSMQAMFELTERTVDMTMAKLIEGFPATLSARIEFHKENLQRLVFEHYQVGHQEEIMTKYDRLIKKFDRIIEAAKGLSEDETIRSETRENDLTSEMEQLEKRLAAFLATVTEQDQNDGVVQSAAGLRMSLRVLRDAYAKTEKADEESLRAIREFVAEHIPGSISTDQDLNRSSQVRSEIRTPQEILQHKDTEINPFGVTEAGLLPEQLLNFVFNVADAKAPFFGLFFDGVPGVPTLMTYPSLLVWEVVLQGLEKDLRKNYRSQDPFMLAEIMHPLGIGLQVISLADPQSGSKFQNRSEMRDPLAILNDVNTRVTPLGITDTDLLPWILLNFVVGVSHGMVPFLGLFFEDMPGFSPKMQYSHLARWNDVLQDWSMDLQALYKDEDLFLLSQISHPSGVGLHILALTDQQRSEVRQQAIPPAAESAVKAVVFDIGNVVVETNFEKAARALIDVGVSGWSVDAIASFLPHSEHNKQFERDEITPEQFAASICGALGIGSLAFKEFKRIWTSVNKPIPDMEAWIRKLKDAGYRIFFLSDANRLHIEHLKANCPVLGLGDRIFTSYELKVRKGDGPEIFHRAGGIIERDFGIKLNEMIFFDDRIENVEHSKLAGIPAVVFTNAEQAALEFSKNIARSEIRQTEDKQAQMPGAAADTSFQEISGAVPFSELIASEKASAVPGLALYSQSPAQPTRAEMRVAVDAAEGIFRTKTVLGIGRQGFQDLLSQLIPSAYAQEATDDRLQTAAKDVLAKAQNAPFQVSVTLNEQPSSNDPLVQLLAEVLIKKPAMRVQVVVPGFSRIALNEFRQDLIKKVIASRKEQGPDTKGVNLIVTADESRILGFIQTNSERALVYDARESGWSALEALLPVFSKNGLTGRTLLVVDDASLSQKSYALLAALDKLFDQNKLPEGVQSAAGLLAQNIQIASEAARAISSAA